MRSPTPVRRARATTRTARPTWRRSPVPALVTLSLLLVPQLGTAQAGTYDGSDPDDPKTLAIDRALGLYDQGLGSRLAVPKGHGPVAGRGVQPIGIAGPGVRFRTELEVGGRIGVVPVRSGYPFCRGDAASLVLEPNADVQVLALSRAEKRPAGEMVASSGLAGTWKVVLAEGAARTKSLAKGTRLRVPVTLDELSEGEQRLKLLLILSLSDLDLTSHVAPEAAEKAGVDSRRAAGAAAPRLTDLDTELRLWRRNTVRAAAKSHRRGYAFAAAAGSPAVLELSFNSTPCERRLSLESPDARP